MAVVAVAAAVVDVVAGHVDCEGWGSTVVAVGGGDPDVNQGDAAVPVVPLDRLCVCVVASADLCVEVLNLEEVEENFLVVAASLHFPL